MTQPPSDTHPVEAALDAFVTRYLAAYPDLDDVYDPQWRSPCETGAPFPGDDGELRVPWQPLRRHGPVDDFAGLERALEMPLLVDLAETGTVPIYGINHRDPPEAALAFLRELGDPYNRISADRNGRVSIDWGVYGLPETFVIDGDGRIAYKHVGPFDRRALEEEILPVVRRLQAEDGS